MTAGPAGRDVPGPAGPRPAVSIGLPVFNGADYLAGTIESILAQDFADFELILCDNASTDATEAICRAAAARDGRVRYHRQPRNLGAAANYNTAFAMARGRYWKWAAHDDPIAPGYLSACVAVLEADPGCVLVHPGTVIIDAEGRETCCYLDLIALDSADPVARLARWMDPPEGLCNPFFGLMRPEVVATTGRHGDYPHCDRVFLAEMALRGRCRRVPAGLFYRRMHPRNSVRANPDMRDLAAWFRGMRPRALTFPMLRLTAGFLGAIRRAPLSTRDRLRAAAVVWRWSRPYRTTMLKELALPFYMNGRATALTRAIRGLFGIPGRVDRRLPPDPARQDLPI